MLRVAALTAAAGVAMLPFFTGRLVGGVDARWYAFMLKGFTDQIGSGHFPLLIGQGPTAWNGGVHPFRSAPVYMLVGGLWKILTAGRLGPFWIEHLTAITSAVVGTLGFYRAAALLLPSRRWAAAAFAFIYLCTPAWLSTVYKAEAYMSYMAFAAIPLVLYGNARTFRGGDGKGYVALGAGLALLWMCHPPIALLTSLTTIFFQAATLAQQGLRHWRRWLFGAAVFAVLAAYYFVSMSELPPRPDSGQASGQAVIWLIGIATFVVGAGRLLHGVRRWGWLIVMGSGLLLLAVTSKAWLIWGLYAVAFGGLCLAVRTVMRADRRESLTSAILVVAAILAAAAAYLSLGRSQPAVNAGVLLRARTNSAILPGFLAPLPLTMDTDIIFQPGWAVDAALALGAAALFFGRRPSPQMFGAAALLLTIAFFHVPWVSDFFLGAFPSAFALIISLPLPHRVMPVLCSFALMAAVMWWSDLPPAPRKLQRLWTWGLVCAVLWSAAQLYPMIRIGLHLTATAEWSAQNLRSENIGLDRYAYDLLRVPDYYSNGVTEPLLESRLISADGSIIIGPDDLAKALEQAAPRQVRLVAHTIPGSSNWLEVTPRLEIAPGEHLIYRFSFDLKQDYSGFMIFTGEHAYREYHLPDAGQPLAFGIGQGHSSILSFWNSGATPEHYRLLISKEPANTLKADGSFFSQLTISKLDPAQLPIRLLSLDPYRVVVHAPVAGYLETFRMMLPGYRAYVDGREAPVLRSKQKLVEVAVPAGAHEVMVRFVGSWRLWIAALVSVAGWLGLLVGWGRPRRRLAAH